MKTETIKLPAYWASALINGDYSGCTDTEEKQINAFLQENPFYGGCLDCSEYPELSRFEGLLTDCLDYTFPVHYYETRENGLNYLIYPCPEKTELLPWQKRGLHYTATGYGSKIPTSRMLLVCSVWRRVYCRIFSNIGTEFIILDKKQVIIGGTK